MLRQQEFHLLQRLMCGCPCLLRGCGLLCLLGLLTAAATEPAEARPRAERVAERRLARAELRRERAEPRAVVPAAVTPAQTLRPGVVRRLLRRGMAPVEIAAITGNGPRTSPAATGVPPMVRQSAQPPASLFVPGERSAGLLTETPPRPNRNGQPAVVADPQVKAAGGTEPDGTRSVLVTGDRPPAEAGDGPIFPGLAADMTGQTSQVEAAPAVTHKPIELLPTPKPQQP